MQEKLLAVILTGIVVGPLLLVCCLGPGFVVAFFGSIASWLAGVDLAVAGLIGLGAAELIRTTLRWRRRAVAEHVRSEMRL